ncbi:major facilitator superfamily domain-containing protein [Diplogelasinospora grovesii]|uniref:Major facilitator superfamily domain-containing protein n=1 Tax=Diplogelasinospora grovesii TaxID=303347 RepID=A0AAN6NFC0_9PEZI|nr:major facilitator superfamily domain-containing protein [Diplogelasinospora grovesii]
MVEKLSDASLGSASASFQPSSIDRHGGATDDASGKTTAPKEDGLVSSAGPAPEMQAYLSGARLFLIMFGLTLTVFLMLLDSSIVATATPKITGEFHSLNDIGWYGTSYLLAKIYTYFNVKWTFLAFFAIFELGSALCGAAVSSQMLIIGRAVAGLGASGLLNGGYTIVALIVPVAKQPGLRGILMGLSFFGLLAGPLIGGALTEYTTWRWCFYINLPCGAVIALFLLLVPIPDYRVVGDGTQAVSQSLRKLDLVGFLLFTPTVIMFILALQWAEAMIPLSLLRRRIIWSSCLNMACFIGCTFTTAFYFPVYFQAARDASPVQSGVDMLPQIITNMIITILTGALVGRVGYYLPFALASGVFTSIGTGLIATLTPTSATGKRVGFQIIQGFQGLGFQIPILAVQNGVRKEDVSVASALVVFSQNLSGAVFLSLAQVIFSNQLRHFLTMHAPSLNADAVIAAGASAADVRNSVPAELLPAVRLAYSDTFDHVMYLGTGAACGAFLFAAGMGWVRINNTKKDS